MTSWLEIQIETHVDACDLVAATVAPYTGGVEIRDAGTLFSTAPDRAAVVALCAPDQAQDVLQAVDETLAHARATGMAVDPVVIRQRVSDEKEWRDVWKQFFRATRVGRRFTVRPSWDPGDAPAGEFIIDLDPGRAFGTGAHPSTRLVIGLGERLQSERNQLATFLDLGCGSGILSIAAARLWPDAVGWAVDNDPEATGCTEENLVRNRVASVRVMTGTLDHVQQKFDLIMANIQADVLSLLAPAMPARLATGGRLILSGLLVEQADPVLQAYQRASFILDERAEEGEWAALMLRHQ